MKNVEDIYPLSPMQEHMLFSSVSNPKNDTLVDQFSFDINHPLDILAFENAWQDLPKIHSILRTAFIWENVKSPVQVVRKAAEIPFNFLDWSDTPMKSVEERLVELKEDERARSLNLGVAPLLRLTLIQISQEQYKLIWISHHIILDRWCFTQLLGDLEERYTIHLTRSREETLKAPPYRNYIEWISRQNKDKTTQYWRSRLHDFRHPLTTCVLCDRTSNSYRLDTSVEISEKDRSQLRGNQITLGTLAQAAWALTLAKVCETSDVVYGLTVSGRPSNLANVDNILGCFIGNVAVRLNLSPDLSVKEFLRHVQNHLLKQRQYEYAAPSMIQQVSGIPNGAALFDSIFIWLAPITQNRGGNLVLEPDKGESRTAVPLSLSISELTDRLMISLTVQDGYKPIRNLEEIAENFKYCFNRLLTVDAKVPLSAIALIVNDARADDEDSSTNDYMLYRTEQNATKVGRKFGDESHIKELIIALWRDCLGVEEVDRNVSFFEYGGTSIVAAALHTQIESNLRCRIPILSLFRNPTINGMHERILEFDGQVSDGWLFPLNKGGEKPPLICVASPEVDTIGYAILARHLPADVPIFLIQAPPTTDQAQRYSPSQLHAMSKEYVEQLLARIPKGPYRLLGNCDGAHLALSMVRDLETREVSVSYLGIVDTWGYYTVSKWYPIHSLFKKLEYYLRQASKALNTKKTDAVVQPAEENHTNLTAAQKTTQLEGENTLESHSQSALDIRREWIEKYGYVRNDPHEPKICVPIHLFRTDRKPWWRINDGEMGWGKQAALVNASIVAGARHETLFREPLAKDLAARIAASLIEEKESNNS